jgi:hypothetical protein
VATLSPLARVVLNVLTSTGAWTAEDLARATKLPAGVVDVALTELVNAGRASGIEPERFASR